MNLRIPTISASLVAIMIPLALYASPSGRVLHSDETRQRAVAAQSLETYLATAYDRSALRFEKSVFKDLQCGDAYFIDIKVPSFWNDIQVDTDYYVQTLTHEAQERLYQALKKNYAKKGLPKCLLADQFETPMAGAFIAYRYNYHPDFTTVMVPAAERDVPANFPCANSIMRPLTSCWNLADPYSH